MFDLKKDIEKALKKYPNLYMLEKGRKAIVKGNFIAKDRASKIEIETYEILIAFPNSYPYRFPKVTEVSDKIPKDQSRHVNVDETLCFGNWQDEFSFCKRGITLVQFLDEVLNPHLCREYAREKNEVYPTGERGHEMEGIWEGYYDIFHTDDKTIILKELELILNQKPIGRNEPCYCQSGRKYKNCHWKIEILVNVIGKDKADWIFESLKADLEKAK